MRGAAGAGRSGLEARVREAWRRPPLPLRLAGAAYAFVHEFRHVLYDVGVAAARPAPVPVFSVGGLAAGGEGKTPVAAAIAARLAAIGGAVAVVTHGEADELALHRTWAPSGVLVLGGPDRAALVRRAAREGAGAAVLDSGFQHRRLARDLEVVVVGVDSLLARPPRRLPAGPFREAPRAAGRADLVVIVHREVPPDAVSRLASWLQRVTDAPVARCHLRDAGVRAANPSARSAGGPPAVAAAGIMWPGPFLSRVRRRFGAGLRTWAVPDHGQPDDREALLQAAGDAGVVCTAKDWARWRGWIGDRTPVWVLEERPEWGEDGPRLDSALRQAWGALAEGRQRPAPGIGDGGTASGSASVERPL